MGITIKVSLCMDLGATRHGSFYFYRSIIKKKPVSVFNYGNHREILPMLRYSKRNKN